MKVRHLILVIVSVVAIFYLTSVVVAQEQDWYSYGPYGGEITALAINPNNDNTALVGVHGGGVYITHNAGNSWAHLETGIPPNANLSSLSFDARDSNIVYATVFGGVYQSINGGTNWNQVSGSTFAGEEIWTLVVVPTSQ